MAENTLATNRPATTDVSATASEATVERDRYVTPAVDIYEQTDGLVVVGDLPGLQKDDIHVSVDKSILTIRGVRRDTAPTDDDYLRREFAPVGFYRQFQLGNTIDQSRIEAEYRHGVLRLKLPFAETAKPRQIAVSVS